MLGKVRNVIVSWLGGQCGDVWYGMADDVEMLMWV